MDHENNNLPPESIEDILDCPTELAKDLAELESVRVFVPAEVDQQILVEARRKLDPIAAKHRKIARRPWWFAAGTGIGVAAAVAVFILPQLRNQKEPMSPNIAADMAFEDAPGLSPQESLDIFDIDGSGRVDILDAYRLASIIESEEQPEDIFDMNNDGAVNAKDVDRIAMDVVKIHIERKALRRVDHDLVPGG